MIGSLGVEGMFSRLVHFMQRVGLCQPRITMKTNEYTVKQLILSLWYLLVTCSRNASTYTVHTALENIEYKPV